GKPMLVASLDMPSGKLSYLRSPYFLPDGLHFLVFGGPPGTIFVGSLDSQELKPLVNADTRAAYSSGYLIFQRQNTLAAQPFDVSRFELKGDAVPVAEGLDTSGYTSPGRAYFSAEGNVLAYRTGFNDTELRW